jgi:LacI family transcriptional regulator
MRREGYRMIVVSSEEDRKLELESIEALLAHQVDGLIVASSLKKADSDIFRRVERQKVPYVLIDREIPDLEADFVGVDDEAVGAIATEHLIQRGNRRIAHIGASQLSTGAGRLRGYMTMMARYGITVPAGYVANVGHAGINAECGGFQAMQQLLAMDPPPDAVFCITGLAAAGALRAILSRGLRVPDDIALIGVSNLPHIDLLKVPLSSIDQSPMLIGERAAKVLLRRVESPSQSRPTRILIPPKLIIRESSAVPPTAKEEPQPVGVSPNLAEDQAGLINT